MSRRLAHRGIALSIKERMPHEPAINREWHLANRMPKNPTLRERALWHFEHEKRCQCRTMTKKLRETLAKALK